MENYYENKVDIYLLEPLMMNTEKENYLDLISDEEKARYHKFKFDEPKKTFLASRILMRRVLSDKLGIRPEEVSFNIDQHGKPHVSGICFNLSHTKGLIVLGVSVGRDIGIDTENLSRKIAGTDIAKRYYAEEEYKKLTSLSGDKKKEYFIKLWTLKEAYIKAVGLGLKIPLDSFSFRIDDDMKIEFISDDERVWQFEMHRIDDHIISLAVSGGEKFTSEIIRYEI